MDSKTFNNESVYFMFCCRQRWSRLLYWMKLMGEKGQVQWGKDAIYKVNLKGRLYYKIGGIYHFCFSNAIWYCKMALNLENLVQLIFNIYILVHHLIGHNIWFVTVEIFSFTIWCTQGLHFVTVRNNTASMYWSIYLYIIFKTQGVFL